MFSCVYCQNEICSIMVLSLNDNTNIKNLFYKIDIIQSFLKLKTVISCFFKIISKFELMAGHSSNVQVSPI